MGWFDTIRVDIKIYYDTQISVKFFCKMPTCIKKNQIITVSEKPIMYKIVDKAGNEVENGFNSFGDALTRIRQLNRLGMKNVFVVDAKTKVIYKRSSKNC